MAGQIVRAAIVGASTLLGKELAEELNSATVLVWDLKLLEAGEAGQVTSAGDEVLVIQSIESGTFLALDVVFFAGDAETTRKYWKDARRAGASIVDCTAAIESEPGVLVRAPTLESSASAVPDLATNAVIPAHPAAVMLAVVMTRLRARWPQARMIATVMEPASQQGSAGLDEMHQQTVALLAFQALPKDVYDEQVAFNLSAKLGEAAKAELSATHARVRRHVSAIAGTATASALTMQLVQAPVFHGYTASAFVEMEENVSIAAAENVLDGGLISITSADTAGPSNIGAAEQGQLLLQVREDSGPRGLWLWMAADNLRLAAQTAAACAAELVKLLPAGKVQ